MDIDIDTIERRVTINDTRTAKQERRVDVSDQQWIESNMPALVQSVISDIEYQQKALIDSGFTLDSDGRYRIRLSDTRWMSVVLIVDANMHNAIDVHIDRRYLDRGYSYVASGSVVEDNVLSAVAMWVAENRKTLKKSVPDVADDTALMSMLPQSIRDKMVEYVPNGDEESGVEEKDDDIFWCDTSKASSMIDTFKASCGSYSSSNSDDLEKIREELSDLKKKLRRRI